MVQNPDEDEEYYTFKGNEINNEDTQDLLNEANKDSGTDFITAIGKINNELGDEGRLVRPRKLRFSFKSFITP